MAGGVFSGAKLHGMTIRESATDGSDFTNPDADYRRLFLGEDGNLHLKDSAGTVTDVGGSGGSVATDAIFDAKGDLAVGTGANTAQKLTAGTNGYKLITDSGETTGLKWVEDPVPWSIIPQGTGPHAQYYAIQAANRAIYQPCIIPVACTITGIRVRIGTSSGNICVGLYSSAGSRLATSGAVASPGTSFQTISFTGSYAASPGRYYLAISADNTSVTFSSPDAGGVVGPSSSRFEASAHPLPATATMSNDANNYNIIGVVSGGYPT